MMADNKKLAQDILQLIGGKDNISFVTHCITRLRFNLKDISIVKQDELKNLSGVLGVNDTGAQYQIIIGPNVDNVYKEVFLVLNELPKWQFDNIPSKVIN